MPEDSYFHRYMDVFAKALEKLGVNPRRQADDYKKLLEDAGFVDVQVHTFKVPMGMEMPPLAVFNMST